MTLANQIEAILFYKACPVTLAYLAKTCSVTEEQIKQAVNELSEQLQTRGIVLIQTTTEITLATNPAFDEQIETIRKDELKRDIGKAGAETLAIILYKEPVTRAEIDRIRGVNSSFILRNLLTRGLINKSETGGKGNVFTISPTLLMHLGIDRKENLPDYAKVLDALESFEEIELANS